MKYPNGDTYEGQYAKLEVDDPAAVAAYEAEKAEKEAAAAEAEPPAEGDQRRPPSFPRSQPPSDTGPGSTPSHPVSSTRAITSRERSRAPAS